MSEYRTPIASFSKRFAEKQGKKTVRKLLKIEIFPAHYFAFSWEPGSTLFYPKPPLHDRKRKEYWEKYFRVRIDGIWVNGKAKYTMFSKGSIVKKWLDW